MNNNDEKQPPQKNFDARRPRYGLVAGHKHRPYREGFVRKRLRQLTGDDVETVWQTTSSCTSSTSLVMYIEDDEEESVRSRRYAKTKVLQYPRHPAKDPFLLLGTSPNYRDFGLSDPQQISVTTKKLVQADPHVEKYLDTEELDSLKRALDVSNGRQKRKSPPGMIRYRCKPFEDCVDGFDSDDDDRHRVGPGQYLYVITNTPLE